MAYTDPWDGTDPPGSTLANRIDDKIRLLRLQLKERLESVLINDITADPWVPKINVSGQKNGKIMVVPAFAFRGGVAQTDGSVLYTSADEAPRAPLILPNGVIVKKIRWLVKKNTGVNTLSFLLRAQVFAVGTPPTFYHSMTKSTVGQEMLNSGTLTIAIGPSIPLWLEITQAPVGQSFNIYGCEITYDALDSRYTL